MTSRTPLLKALFREHRLPTRYYVAITNFLINPFIKFRINKNKKKLKKYIDYLTVIITSAGRKEYLKRTIESLRKNILYDKNKIFWYIIDDCPQDFETREYIKYLDFHLKILNKKNRGLGYSLNRIYSEIKTEFVFHCEDDWEFLKPIPIKKLIKILNQNQSFIQLLLNKYAGYHEKIILKNEFVEYPDWFSFNPHIANSEIILKNLPFPLKETEELWTKKIRSKGYKSIIFEYKEKNSFVKHLGKTKKVFKF